MFRSAVVVGAGVMGAGIARHLAAHVEHVTLLDISASQIETARQASPDLPIKYSTDFDLLATADYVIEAVFEDLEVKQRVLREISRRCPDTAIIATNTSSLLVSELSDAIDSAERFLGVHYNNPADMNPVVEVIAGPATKVSNADDVLGWMKSTGKLAIACADTSGFILNRQSLPYMNESVRCLDVATTGEIDHVARARLGVGLGPFAVMNLVGLPVMAAASRNLSILGRGYEAAPALQAQASTATSHWSIPDAEAVDDARTQLIYERLLGAQLFPGKDILDRSLCAAEDLHTICIEALGYERSSPELVDQIPADEVARLIECFLASSSSR